jgi:hypothetical protein
LIFHRGGEQTFWDAAPNDKGCCNDFTSSAGSNRTWYLHRVFTLLRDDIRNSCAANTASAGAAAAGYSAELRHRDRQHNNAMCRLGVDVF